MIAMKVDNRYLVSLRFHKKPKYKRVRQNELEIDEAQVWSIVEMQGKDADEKLSEYLYESIETVFRLPRCRRFNKFVQLMQKASLTFDDYIDEDCLMECGYITYGIHPLSLLASDIQSISVKELR